VGHELALGALDGEPIGGRQLGLDRGEHVRLTAGVDQQSGLARIENEPIRRDLSRKCAKKRPSCTL
jgi:hypothetical protein